jgi:hypothetical protein
LDALQRIVQTSIKQEHRSEGEQNINLPVGALPSGMYVVRVSVQEATGKMTTVHRPVIIVR